MPLYGMQSHTHSEKTIEVETPHTRGTHEYSALGGVPPITIENMPHLAHTRHAYSLQPTLLFHIMFSLLVMMKKQNPHFVPLLLSNLNLTPTVNTTESNFKIDPGISSKGSLQ